MAKAEEAARTLDSRVQSGSAPGSGGGSAPDGDGPQRGEHSNRARLDEPEEPVLRAQWREWVERQPLLAVTGAAAVGATLGGLLFSRMGRLAFFAAAGYVANELWHSERRIELSELIAKMSGPTHSHPR